MVSRFARTASSALRVFRWRFADLATSSAISIVTVNVQGRLADQLQPLYLGFPGTLQIYVSQVEPQDFQLLLRDRPHAPIPVRKWAWSSVMNFHGVELLYGHDGCCGCERSLLFRAQHCVMAVAVTVALSRFPSQCAQHSTQ